MQPRSIQLRPPHLESREMEDGSGPSAIITVATSIERHASRQFFIHKWNKEQPFGAGWRSRAHPINLEFERPAAAAPTTTAFFSLRNYTHRSLLLSWALFRWRVPLSASMPGVLIQRVLYAVSDHVCSCSKKRVAYAYLFHCLVFMRGQDVACRLCNPFRRMHMQINFTAHVFSASRGARALKTTTNTRSTLQRIIARLESGERRVVFLFLKDGRLSFVSCVFEVCVYRFSPFYYARAALTGEENQIEFCPRKFLDNKDKS